MACRTPGGVPGTEMVSTARIRRPKGPDATPLWYPPQPLQPFGFTGVFMTEPEDDGVCVARCLRGEPAAFEPIVRRYQRVLFSVAHRMLGNYEDALDATQNAFVRAYDGLDSYDPSRRFFSWIYRITVNECLNFRRARRDTE